MALTSSQLGRLRKAETGRLRLARQMANLTQEQLAGEVGVTQSSLSDLERGRYGNTTVETARRFADFFGCTIEDLFPAKQEVA